MSMCSKHAILNQKQISTEKFGYGNVNFDWVI